MRSVTTKQIEINKKKKKIMNNTDFRKSGEVNDAEEALSPMENLI